MLSKTAFKFFHFNSQLIQFVDKDVKQMPNNTWIKLGITMKLHNQANYPQFYHQPTASLSSEYPIAYTGVIKFTSL
jgi:hypothetical protein